MTYWHTTNGEGYDSLAVTVDHTVDIRIAFVKLAVDEPLDIAFRRFFIHWVGILDVVFLDVFSTCDKSWSERTRDEKRRWVLGVANTDMSVCIEDLLMVEDVVCGD